MRRRRCPSVTATATRSTTRIETASPRADFASPALRPTVISSSSSSTTRQCTRSSSAPRRIQSSRAGRRDRIRCSSPSWVPASTTRPPNGCPSSSPPSGPTAPSWQSPCAVADHDFTTVDSETIYVGKSLPLRADEVKMPGGRTARREVVEHYGAVGIVALDENDNVAMVYQYRHPVGRRLWELPAGLLDIGGEAPHLSAARELEEEAGLAAPELGGL